MSVLVVEDDRRLRDFLDVVVRRCGLTCHSVGSGDAALDAIRTEKYAVVLLDLMLPGMTGFEVLRSVRATHPHLLRRIIVLTAVSQAALDRQFDSQSLIWSIIRKPFDVGDLERTIDECFRYHTTEWPSRSTLSTWLADREQHCGAQAVVVTAIDGGATLRVLAAHGFRSRLLKKHFPMLMSAPYPICVAARTGRAVWLASVSLQHEYPLCGVWTKSGSRAIATVPLQHNGLITGAMGWSFAAPQTFDDHQRAMLLEAASDCVAMIPAARNGYLQIS
ncbi:MAG TPA: response regulator [Thermoanaerobaculia bacterium]|nr:response regulator [Thermoanaerobaculia bacterium]